MLRLFSLICFLVTGCNFREPEMFLIPKGYMGKMTIIYNQPKGAEIEYEKNVRVYKIPANGILFSQFKPNYNGYLQQKYFYVGSLNNRVAIPIVEYSHDSVGKVIWPIKDSSLVSVFDKGVSGIYGNNEYSFQESTVTDGNHLEVHFSKSYVQEFEKKLSELLHDDFGTNEKLDVK